MGSSPIEITKTFNIMKKIILFVISVLLVLSSCSIVSTICANKKLNKSKLTDNIELPSHGPYQYLTKDGDSKIITIEYILKNGNYKELDPILRNNIKNYIINSNSKELSIPGHCTDSLSHIVRNTLSKFDTVITYQIIISNP